jgi:hypothetical protein
LFDNIESTVQIVTAIHHESTRTHTFSQTYDWNKHENKAAARTTADNSPQQKMYLLVNYSGCTQTKEKMDTDICTHNAHRREYFNETTVHKKQIK